MSNPSPISRRDLFSSLFEPFRAGGAKFVQSASGKVPGPQPRVAIVQGRFCLAFRNSLCAICHERCPVPGAIMVENGIPRIIPEICNGCGLCRDVCPAPANAILMKEEG